MTHDPINAPLQTAWHDELQRVLSSACFAGAARISDLLSFLVQESLAGRGDRLKEYVIGVEVFGRGADFDPRVDTNVRTEAWRLRARLARYYAGEGVGNPAQIQLPRRSFVPRLHRPAVSPPAALQPVPTDTPVDEADALHLAIEAAQGPAAQPCAPWEQALASELALELGDHPGLRLYTAQPDTDATLLMRTEVRVAAGQMRALVHVVQRHDGRLVWSHGCQHPATDEVGLPRRLAQDIGRAMMTGPLGRGKAFNRPVATAPVRPGFVRRVLSSGAESAHVDLETVRREARRVDCWLLHNPHDQAAHRRLARLLSWCVCVAPTTSPELAPLLRRCSRELLSQAEPAADALVELGLAAMVDFDWYGALHLLNAAIAADPACSDARVVRGLCGLLMGHTAAALEDLEVACEVDPTSALACATLGLAHYHQHRFAQAADLARGTLALDPHCEPATVLLADSALCGGEAARGMDVLHQACTSSGRCPVILGRLGHTYAMTGRRQLAQTLLRELQCGVGGPPVYAAIADIHLGLGDPDAAFVQLGLAVERRALPDLLVLRSAPRYDGLRRDARFRELIDQMSLPAAA